MTGILPGLLGLLIMTNWLYRMVAQFNTVDKERDR